MNHKIKILFLLLFTPFFTIHVFSQAGTTLNADGETDTYQLIESFGYGVEVPDCGHKMPHITQVFDAELQKNVFAFTLHPGLDDDRCASQDRQRVEIKTFGPSPESMKGYPGQKQMYKWKFKLAKDFSISPAFCHIHQVKADAGPNTGMPLISLTPTLTDKGEFLEFRQHDFDRKTVLLASVPLKKIKGKWVEVTETIEHGHAGKIEMTINRVSNGRRLLYAKKSNLNLWREGSNFNRPKYGLYRSILHPGYLKDETILFSDIEFYNLNATSEAKLTEKIYNLRDFSPVADGKTLDSPVIQKAIDHCSANGGGTVVIPPGTYLCGTIQMKDNVRIYLDKNALLLGSIDLEDYKNVDPFKEGLGIDVGWAFIAAVGVKNIGIEGEGIIDGQGSAIKAKQILTDNRSESQRWGRRPFLLRVFNCENVKVQGVTLMYSGAWTSHYSQSKNIVIDDVKIKSVGVAHNDGINIDGCADVKITNCDVESGDDALCFKTTHSQSPNKNIVVKGMRLKSNQAGIKMGTESMSAFENIQISDIYIYDTRNGGIKLLPVDGAHLKNITITDVTMNNVRTPMLFRLGSRLKVFREGDVQQSTGSFDNVLIKNVKAKSDSVTQLNPASGILITGIPGHYINNLTLENIEIELPGGGKKEHAERKVQEAVDQYPEIKTFGPYIPAYGVWARHVRNLTLKNVSFKLDNPDLRPVLICEDAENVKVDKFVSGSGNEKRALIQFEDVNKIDMSGFQSKIKPKILIDVKGVNNKNISFNGKRFL